MDIPLITALIIDNRFPVLVPPLNLCCLNCCLGKPVLWAKCPMVLQFLRHTDNIKAGKFFATRRMVIVKQKRFWSGKTLFSPDNFQFETDEGQPQVLSFFLLTSYQE